MNMDDKNTIDNIQKLREIYTFDRHKDMVIDWEKQLRMNIVINDLTKTDAAKTLVKNLGNMIDDISRLLSWDEELEKDQRDKLFVRRDAYKWLVSFFEEPEKSNKRIKEKVKKEIDNNK